MPTCVNFHKSMIDNITFRFIIISFTSNILCSTNPSIMISSSVSIIFISKKNLLFQAKMECLVRILLWSSVLTWTRVNSQFSGGRGKEVFFVNLEEGFFGCQVNETAEVLQIFKINKLCDGVSDCFRGSDENSKELKCSSK